MLLEGVDTRKMPGSPADLFKAGRVDREGYDALIKATAEPKTPGIDLACPLKRVISPQTVLEDGFPSTELLEGVVGHKPELNGAAHHNPAEFRRQLLEDFTSMAVVGIQGLKVVSA
jgi:hypothetical protein